MARHFQQWGRPETYLVNAKEEQIDPLLVKLLSLCTPHGHEQHIRRVITDLKFVQEHKLTVIDDNVLIEVLAAKDKEVSSTETMFSCHMDIVGSVSKVNSDGGYVDEIVLMADKEFDFLFGAKKIIVKGEVKRLEPCTLGADDKVGVFIMLRMIEKKIPGLYVFHVGEECGGIGSRKLANNHKELFKDIKRAIAFDRAGYTDVICFQRGGRCCSDEFGKALAASLNVTMPPKEQFVSGITGTFTDTANYRDIIPECTNLSVGYFNQHGSGEKLDYYWLKHIFMPGVFKVDWGKLPTVRDPKAVTTYPAYNNRYTPINNTTRKTWEEANEDTYMMDLPLWHPSMGWPKGANANVLSRAIRNYIIQAYVIADKETMAKAHLGLLEKNKLLEDQLVITKTLIKALQDKVKGTQKLLAPPKILEEITDANLSEDPLKEFKEDLDKIEDPFDKDAAEATAVKKQYIIGLTVATKGLAKATEQHLRAIDFQLLQGYCVGAVNFLNAHEETVAFTRKEARKANRIIYQMGYILTMVGEDAMDPFSNNLLDQVWTYIGENIHEEGFDMPKKVQDMHKNVKYNTH